MNAPEPISESVKVVQLLVGTLAGCLSLGLCFYWFWGIAWVIPTVLAVFTLPWEPTRRIGIGFAAAALGAFVAITLTLHLTPGGQDVTPRPPPVHTDPAASQAGKDRATQPAQAVRIASDTRPKFMSSSILSMKW
jgi:hypothetical protein